MQFRKKFKKKEIREQLVRDLVDKNEKGTQQSLGKATNATVIGRFKKHSGLSNGDEMYRKMANSHEDYMFLGGDSTDIQSQYGD